MDKTGVIYILTNPSFPEYVKIGYADDIDKRLQQLNRSECIPFAFRVYATYEVNSRLSDLKIHSIIDKLNPNLRSIENFNGKQRVREFYAMSPEDAYSILEAIAEIHGCADKLKRIDMDEAQKQAEETAQEIDAEHKERQSPFRFSMCNIQPGEEIEYCNNPEIKCTVVSVNLNRTGATLTEDIEEGERIKSLEKSTQLSEKAKMRKSALLYLIETNLYLVNERKEEAIDSSKLSELLSFAKWIIYLQNSSDLCFHTDSDTKLIVEDDYRIDVELGENYSQTFEKESQRRIIAEPFNLRGDNTDRDFFEKVANAFYEDLGVHFKVLESVLHHLSDSSFSHDNVEFDEIAPNVIKAKATDVLNDYLSFVVENVPVEDVKSAYDFLTIVPGQLKTICDTTHPILPIWEREKRNHCFAVRPIYMSNNDYIYSPIIMEEVRKRWIEGFLQFYPPFEIGLERTCTALYAWKNNYEHLFSSEVEVLLKESGCEYAKHDVDLRREDRRGNHPTIDVLGDYDVIGLNTTQKRIFIIECKVLQPIGSVFEHSNQQKRFFTKEKFDEKFQKRIDYFSKVAMSFFANHGYDTEGFTINPYMVVNKVFSSYYKHVQFPIVTFDELKREIQL